MGSGAWALGRDNATWTSPGCERGGIAPLMGPLGRLSRGAG